MISNHPESCILCNQGNRCELRKIASDLGVGDTGLYPMPHYTGLEESNPFIIRDLSKCILCGRCIRADHELVLVGAIDYNLRGLKSKPTAVHGLPLEKSECTFCGTCVSMCQTGALMTKNTQYAGSPQKESSTICGFCGVGCSLAQAGRAEWSAGFDFHSRMGAGRRATQARASGTANNPSPSLEPRRLHSQARLRETQILRPRQKPHAEPRPKLPGTPAIGV